MYLVSVARYKFPNVFFELVVYDWVFVATFIAVKWYFDSGHHIGATTFGIIDINFAISTKLVRNK